MRIVVCVIKGSLLPILDDAVGVLVLYLELLESCWFGLSFPNFVVVPILNDAV